MFNHVSTKMRLDSICSVRLLQAVVNLSGTHLQLCMIISINRYDVTLNFSGSL